MTPRNYLTHGIIVKRSNYSEADRIVTIYTKDYGKIRLLAKGVRRPRSRKRGHLEIFTHVKFSANKSRGMDILTEVDTTDVYKLNKNINRVSVAYFLAETIDKLTQDGERNHELYTLLLKSFKELESSKNLKKFRLSFVRETLVVLGFWPSDRIMHDPDSVLESVVERKMNSVRVGRKIV